MSQSPDLCIVGASALGIELALYARRLGADVVLARRERPEPGDAADMAVRAAALAATADQAQSMTRAALLGLGNDTPKPMFKAIAERVNRVAAARAAAQDDAILGARGVTIMRGPVQFQDSRSLLVGDIVVRPRQIVVAVGARPVIPSIDGLSEIAFFDTDSIYDNTRKLTHLLVIGGGESALELAQMYRRLGAEVTLVTQGGLLPGYDREAVAILMRALVEDGVRVLDESRVTKILPRTQGTGILVEHPGGDTEALDVSHVLVATGRSADFDGLEIEKAQLRPGRKLGHSLVLGPLGQTSNARVRFVGAAAGVDQWSAARAHGRAVIDALVGGGATATPIAPRLVQTRPSLAQIGPMLEKDDKARPGTQILRANLAENDMLAARGFDGGLIKLVTRPDGRILRGAVVGPGAAELAGAIALAMHRQIGLSGLASLPLPRPSLWSSLQELAEGNTPARPPSALLRLRRTFASLLPR